MYECDSEVRRGPWTVDEDNLLIQYVTSHGEGRWNSLAKFAGLKRSGKSCRLRWLNYLKPDIKRGNLTPHEQLFILELHSKFGNRWSKIAQHLPGRTDNEIKNYWRTRVQKQARQLNIDSNSTKFLETIRTFFMEPSSSSISAVDPQHSAPSTNMLNNSECSKIAAENLTGPAAGKINNQVVENNNYSHVDMEELECQDVCHVEGNGWLGEDLAGSCSFWNTDELWQFRKFDQVNI